VISISQGPTSAPAQVAADLRIPKGSSVWLRKRTVANSRRTVQIGRAYLPRDITEGTLIETLGSSEPGTYACLRELGYSITKFTETVAAAPAAKWEATALGLNPSPPHQVVLRIERVAHGTERPLEVDYITARPARLKLIYELPAD
jgi:DNA-binding GntR family transcriptional regulator